MNRALAIIAAAAIAVLGAGAAVALTGAAAAPVDTCELSVTEALLSNRIVGSSQSYRKDNPSEYTRVRAFLDGGARPTGSLTHMGLHLVALEDTCRALAVPPPTTTTGTTTTTTTDTTTTTEPPPPPPPTGSANVWVDANGGSCSRASTPVAYADATACGSFSAAYGAASGGDTIRVKAAIYPGSQSVGGSKTPIITVIGEDGTQVESLLTPGGGVRGFSLGGNVTVVNVDVGGVQPFMYVGGNNSTWRESRLLESCSTNLCARGTHSGVPEPILIYADQAAPITNAKLIDIVVEPQHVCTPGQGSCPGGDVYHLESIRIDQNVDGVLIDRVTFLSGGDDNTALIFITRPSLGVPGPRNVTIRNSVFGNHGGSYNIDFGGRGPCAGFVFAYNTFTKERLSSCTSPSSIQWIGNIGPKSPNGINCTSGTTWTRNVWQWAGDPRVCSGESTSTWVSGPNYSISGMNLDANFRPLAGSPVIDAGETSYCTGALGAIDRDGDSRVAPCDAGAFER